jgi:hypothetical protein
MKDNIAVYECRQCDFSTLDLHGTRRHAEAGHRVTVHFYQRVQAPDPDSGLEAGVTVFPDASLVFDEVSAVRGFGDLVSIIFRYKGEAVYTHSVPNVSTPGDSAAMLLTNGAYGEIHGMIKAT